MKRILLGLLFCASSALACSPTRGWSFFPVTITGLNNVQILDSAFAVDSNCTTSVRITFKGTAPGGQYAVFTLPNGFPIYLAMYGWIKATGVGNGGGTVATFPFSDAVHVLVTPWDARIPGAGEQDEYSVAGSYQTP